MAGSRPAPKRHWGPAPNPGWGPAPIPSSTVTLQVNGQRHRLAVQHRWTLLDVLREQLDLTGAKRGCDRGECGACTVLLAGQPVYACQLLAIQAGQRPVVTIEGLALRSFPHGKDSGQAQGGRLDPVQQAFLDNDGGQCGYCTPGFVLAARALLDANPSPTDADIRHALSGNLCRCNAYGRILQSVREAARLRRTGI